MFKCLTPCPYIFMKLTNYLKLSRLHQPIGIWLLMWPCFWGLALSKSPWHWYLLFSLGSIIMRSAGCVFNDWVDSDIDVLVNRTCKRPLADKILSPYQGIVFFVILCSLGGIIFYYLSYYAKIFSIFAFLLLIIYPWLKRITYFPQLILGLAFNSGVLIATSHVMPWELWQQQKPLIICLYISGVFWTMAYDTIYALQDLEDDKKIGIKSTAVYFNSHSKIAIICFYSLMLLCLFYCWLSLYTHAYSLLWLLLIVLLLVRWLKVWDLQHKGSNLWMFQQNNFLGFFIWISIEMVRIITK